MDCKNARLLLAFSHPSGELDAAEASLLQRHLDECPYCSELANNEQRFDQAIGKAMLAVEPPEGLRMRLVAKLDKERDRWYRRFGVRVAAVAAGILVMIIGSWLWFSRPANLNVEQVKNEANDQYRAMEENVDSWVKREGGAHLAAPEQFDYRFFVAAHMAELKGRRVPALFFLRGDLNAEFALVYVLDDSSFDLESIQSQNITPGSGVSVRLLPHRSGRILFLVIHNSRDLEQFLTRDRHL